MVSCIISTYKRDVNILKRAIKSVLNQTYNDIELIVVNDAPEEKVLCTQICHMISELNDGRIMYLEHKQNMGACAARNTGASKARGEYLAFLDDDDEWLPNKLAKQLELMKDENIGLVYCDNYNIYKGKSTVHIHSNPKHFETIVDELLYGNFIGSVSFPLIRKNFFDQVGGFDPSIRSSQDVDLWIRLLKISKSAYCREALVNYYVSVTSITTNINAKRQGYERLLEKYADDYKSNKELYIKKILNIAGVFILFNEEQLACYYYNIAKNNGASTLQIHINLAKSNLLKVRRRFIQY